MKTSRILRALIAACGLGAALHAEAVETVTCPAVFPMKTIHFDRTDDGWTAEPGERAPGLVGWGLYSGPPAELAALIPSGDSKGYSSWKLEGPAPEGIWVQCTYADWALTLTRRLSITDGVCSVPDKKSRSRKPQPVSFVCK